MVAGLWEGENHASATAADRHNRLCFVLASGLGVSVPAKIAFAADWLTAPSSAAPPNRHWYYRTDRTQDRKCWHLQTDGGAPEQAAVHAVREAPAKPSKAVAGASSFKDSVTQHAGAKPSDQDVETLYAEFLEWRRRAKN